MHMLTLKFLARLNQAILLWIVAIIAACHTFSAASAQTPQVQPTITAPAVQCDLYLDRSGSMAGFNAVGKAREEFQALIKPFMDRCKRLRTFNTRVDPLVMAAPPENLIFTGDTDLYEALTTWLTSYDTGQGANSKDPAGTRRQLILITDNVTSLAGSSSAKDKAQQQRFYSLLSDPNNRLSHISVLLMRRAFKGDVYSASNVRQLYPSRGDALPRALSVYLIEQNGGKDDDAMFEVTKANLNASFGADTVVDSGGADEGANYQNKIVRLRLQPFLPTRTSKATEPVVEVTELSPGLSAVDALGPTAGRNFVYNLSSREAGVIGGQGQIKWNAPWSLKKSPLKVQWVANSETANLAQAQELVGQTIDCLATPNELAFPATNGQPVPFEFKFQCPLKSKFDQLSKQRQIELGQKDEVDIQGQIKFVIDINQASDLELQGPVRRAFELPTGSDIGQPDPEVQGRINELSGLIANMIPREGRAVQVDGIALSFRINPPSGAAALDFLRRAWGIILPILLAIGLVVWQVSSELRLRVTGSADLSKIVSLKPFDSDSVNLGSGIQAKLRRAFGILFLTGGLGTRHVSIGTIVSQDAVPNAKSQQVRPDHRTSASTARTEASSRDGVVWLKVERGFGGATSRSAGARATSMNSGSSRGRRGRS
jgi:hypothetical protein